MIATTKNIRLLFKTIGFSILGILLVFSACSNKKDTSKKNPAQKMQDFIINISEYSRSIHPNFIIIPQNGCELAFENGKANTEINEGYLDAVDAIAVEELFYNGTYEPDTFRIDILRKIKKYKPILVSEFITDDDSIRDAIRKNEREDFICFPRSKGNYHYELIPDKVSNRNTADISTMEQAQNYLYLINNTEFDDKKQFINAIRKTNFDVVTIDLFFGDDETFTAEEINQLKVKANGGKRIVICYINIGAAEKWRYYWKPGWTLGSPGFIKKKYKDYDKEFWVAYWEKDWQNIIYGNDASYMKKIIDAGFDGAFLDNAEAYYFLYKDK